MIRETSTSRCPTVPGWASAPPLLLGNGRVWSQGGRRGRKTRRGVALEGGAERRLQVHAGCGALIRYGRTDYREIPT